jgi:selenide,water dikinase
MGGTPLFALALVGMPVNQLPVETIRRVLEGGEAICAKANIPIAGGHSIDSVEPIYGLVAIGVAHPRVVKRNSTAASGDVLVLGKPLGVGILSAALKKNQLTEADYEAMIATTTMLNRAGPELAQLPGVHAMTDVTGFGLLGHLLELCRGSRLGARLVAASVPVLDNVLTLAENGVVTGASERNWASYGDRVRFAGDADTPMRQLLCDPQTSGGLLVSCAPEAVDAVLEVFRRYGCDRAGSIGTMHEGAAIVDVLK